MRIFITLWIIIFITSLIHFKILNNVFSHMEIEPNEYSKYFWGDVFLQFISAALVFLILIIFPHLSNSYFSFYQGSVTIFFLIFPALLYYLNNLNFKKFIKIFYLVSLFSGILSFSVVVFFEMFHR